MEEKREIKENSTEYTAQKCKTTEDNTVAALYKIGLLIFIPLFLLFFFCRTELGLNTLIKGGYSCAFKRMTGINCPGCGGTRASFYLARLRLVDSFRMNAVVPVSVVLYLFFMIWQTLHKFFGIKSLKEKHIYIMLAIFVITVVVRWIVVNIYIWSVINV